jgi:hypothetical protein
MIMSDLSLKLPKINDVLHNYQTVPAYSLLLGIGDDNIPLMLDLTEPGAGSFLVASDSEEVNKRILTSMLTSAYQQNTQYELSIHLITLSEQLRRYSKDQPLLRNEISPEDPAAEVLIEEMGELLDKRQDDRIQLPVQLLVLDGMPGLLAGLSPSTQSGLLRLIKHGPFWGIWVIGTMTTSQLDVSFYEVIEGFPSRIVGMIKDDEYARYFTGLPWANLRDLTPMEALLRAGEDVFSVWIPRCKQE